MFGPLFGIGQQLLGQLLVFFIVAAARTRPCQGSHGHTTIDHADHYLGRAADERDARRAEIEHERAGIHDPQRAINLERMRRNVEFQSLADDDLKNIARADVFDALADRLLEIDLREIRFVGNLRRARGIDIHRRQLGANGGELLDRGVDTLFRIGIGFGRGKLIEPRECHHHDRLVDVVEHHHPIEKCERKVGQMTIVGRGVRQVLGVAHHVVTGIADRARP